MKTLKKLKQKINLFCKTHKQLFNNLQKTFNNYFKNMKKLFIFSAILAVLQTFIACNVTRKVTTEASYFQKGDTTTTIVTKTIETYDAKKNTQNF